MNENFDIYLSSKFLHLAEYCLGSTLTVPWCCIDIIDTLFYRLTYRFDGVGLIIRASNNIII